MDGIGDDEKEDEEEEEVARGMFSVTALLEARIAEAEKSLLHLERSNVELTALLDEDDEERTFACAIEENVVIIAKRRTQIEAWKAEILRATNASLLDDDDGDG